eukprot:gene8326-8412_t
MYSWTAILTAIISFGMETTFFRYINKNEHDKDMVYCNTFIGIALTCGIFLLVVFSGISGIAFWLNDGNKESLADYIFYIRCLSLVLVIDALCAIPFAYMPNISYIINENLDKIMLGKLLPPTISEQEVGIYGACAKIALFLSLFVQAFRLGAEPFFFTNIEVLKYFIKGHDVIQQNIYWSGLGVVPLLLFGYMSLGIYMNLSVWFKLSDQTKYGLYITGIAAILTVVLNFIFIPKYSYMASAWISFVAYATMMVLAYFWGQKNYPIPYNVKKNVLYILFSGLLVYLSFSVFKRNLIIGNLLLISFVGSTIYFERKNLASMLKIKRTEAA